MSYNHRTIDTKWQQRWEASKAFVAKQDSNKPKYYALDMFPYPSGTGLHVGHITSYTPSDIVSRYKRARGFEVLHPMGYDAFGLPAEQFAIETGIHPAATTQKAIANFRRQLMDFGFSFDWTREISTCDASYYKWTQWIFLQLWKKGLAYQREVPVNWCPALRTVLANEEVVDGKSERGGHPVVRLPMRQWMIRITAYADRLLEGLDRIDWPERTKEGQRNWIGKSVGASLEFSVQDSPHRIEVFTTRPDTLFGVTYLALAPEHPLVGSLTTSAQKNLILAYQDQTSRKLEVDRKAAVEKTGVFTGSFAVHPFTKKPIQIWIADYVLMDYGTGAVMAVPAHDERDFAFAKKMGLPIETVVTGGEIPFTGDGTAVNSEFLNGLSTLQAKEKCIAELQRLGIGRPQVQYKLRDWLFSRQRYWGEPFPLLQDSSGEIQAVPENELPVELPEVADYQPSTEGEPPLARVAPWVQHSSGLKRITDTMPGSAGSSWYFLRFTDPLNSAAAFSFAAQKYWMPVDLYIGGPEHTVGHLLYSRFWQKVLFDLGLVSHDEPFQKLFHQGVLQGTDGERMSKSRGNTISTDFARDSWGADATRMYICFMGPMEKDKVWSTQGVEGVRRFLDRLWRLVFDEQGKVHVTDSPPSPEIERLLHKTIAKVQKDIEALSFNTCVSQFMILTNELTKRNERSRQTLLTLSQLLMPFAPHFAEELWENLGGQGLVSLAPWPTFDPKLIVDDAVTIGVQVNGKTRGSVELPLTATEEEAVAMALAVPTVSQALGGGAPKKVIYRAGKILNLMT